MWALGWEGSRYLAAGSVKKVLPRRCVTKDVIWKSPVARQGFEAFLRNQAPADLAYDWPGNVRELENAIECAVALNSDSVLTVDDLTSVPNGASAGNLPDSNELVPLAQAERRAVPHALRETGGDKLVARLLGIGKTTLYRSSKSMPELPRQPTGMRVT